MLKRALKAGMRRLAFLAILPSELQGINTCFKATECELAQVLHGYVQRVISKGDASFIDLCNRLDRLRENVLASSLAACKIVQNHDKARWSAPPPPLAA